MGSTQSCGIGVLNKSTIPEINIGLSMHATHYYENRVKENEIFYRWPGPMLYTVYAYARDPTGKNDITNGQVAKEVLLSAVSGGVAVVRVAGIVAAALAGLESEADVDGGAEEILNTAIDGGAEEILNTAVDGGAEEILNTGVDGGAEGIGEDSGNGVGTKIASALSAYRTMEGYTRALGLACKKSSLYCECKGNFSGGGGTWLVIEGGPYMDEHGKIQPCDLSIRKATQEELAANGVFTKVSHKKFHTREGLQCTKSCPYCKK